MDSNAYRKGNKNTWRGRMAEDVKGSMDGRAGEPGKWDPSGPPRDRILEAVVSFYFRWLQVSVKRQWNLLNIY